MRWRLRSSGAGVRRARLFKRAWSGWRSECLSGLPFNGTPLLRTPALVSCLPLGQCVVAARETGVGGLSLPRSCRLSAVGGRANGSSPHPGLAVPTSCCPASQPARPRSLVSAAAHKATQPTAIDAPDRDPPARPFNGFGLESMSSIQTRGLRGVRCACPAPPAAQSSVGAVLSTGS